MIRGLLILLLTSFFISCSSTYKTTYFPSKEDFNKYFNKKTKNEKLNLEFYSDSILTTNSKTIIHTDTLTIYTKKAINEEIPLKEIKAINYKTADYRSANLSLKSGKELDVEGIVFQSNLLKYKVNEAEVIQRNIPLRLIKEVSYKKHWKSIIPGFFSGILIGGVIGATGLVIHIQDGGMHEEFDSGTSGVFGSFLGAIIGSIVGYIIGFEYNFQFNN